MQMRKWREDEWWVISRKFVEHCRLPRGSKAVLRSARSGRAVRRDRIFKYRPFADEADDDWTAARALGLLRASLTADLSRRRLEPELVGPNGETPGGDTPLAEIRRWPPARPGPETEGQRFREVEIEEVAALAETALKAVEMRREPDAVCAGHVRALARRFGPAAVRAALDSLPEGGSG